jgi:hypothetical protein
MRDPIKRRHVTPISTRKREYWTTAVPAVTAKRVKREDNYIDEAAIIAIETAVPSRKRSRSPDSETDLVKRLCAASIADDTPYLSIREIEQVPVVKRRNPESIYLSFSMWDIDYRQWAASDIQRVFKGYLARKRYRLQYITT